MYNGTISVVMDKSFLQDAQPAEISGSVRFDKIIKEEISPKYPKLKPSDIKDPEKVRGIYRELRTDKLPPVEMIDEQWAIFRRLQVDCLASMEYSDSLREGYFKFFCPDGILFPRECGLENVPLND